MSNVVKSKVKVHTTRRRIYRKEMPVSSLRRHSDITFALLQDYNLFLKHGYKYIFTYKYKEKFKNTNCSFMQ